jgi:hypothetical protein
VFGPAVEDIGWERMVEHARAAQMRVWGGGANLIVPLGRDLVEDEVFWRIVEVFDPDLIGDVGPDAAYNRGIELESGAQESLAFVRRLNFEPSATAFDDTMLR